MLDVYVIEVDTWALRGYSGAETARQSALPKQFRLKTEEVEIFRRGDEIVLREKDANDGSSI